MILLVLSSCTLFTVISMAKYRVNIDELADQAAKTIANAHLRSVLVIDFQTSDGKSSDLGWYLANQFSDALLRRDQKFRVLDRAELKNLKVSMDDLRSAEILRRLGSVWGVECVIAGTIDTLSEHYEVAVRILRVADATTAATASQPVRIPRHWIS